MFLSVVLSFRNFSEGPGKLCALFYALCVVSLPLFCHLAQLRPLNYTQTKTECIWVLVLYAIMSKYFAQKRC